MLPSFFRSERTNERTNVINNPLVTRHGTLKHENLLIDRYRNHVAPYGTDLFVPPPLGGRGESRDIVNIDTKKKERKEKETRIRHRAFDSERQKRLGRKVSVKEILLSSNKFIVYTIQLT